QFAEMNLEERLLGDAAHAYVARDQLLRVAGVAYASIGIQEEYAIGEVEFSEQFISETMQQLLPGGFKHVDFFEALESLSSFAADVSRDISADQLAEDMG